MPGDVIILQKCTKNHDMLCYWDMVHDGCNYFSFYPNQQNIYPSLLKTNFIWSYSFSGSTDIYLLIYLWPSG